ncbi:hypothetical protein [Helicobacter sp. T3_23-1059]
MSLCSFCASKFCICNDKIHIFIMFGILSLPNAKNPRQAQNLAKSSKI